MIDKIKTLLKRGLPILSIVIVLMILFSLFRPIYFGRYCWFYRTHPFMAKDYKRFYLFKKCERTNEGCWWIDGMVDLKTREIKFGLVEKYGYEK